MKRTQANKEIYKQAKWLRGKVPLDSNVYIHWKDDNPTVLADKQSGYDLITTVKLTSILRRQVWLTA